MSLKNHTIPVYIPPKKETKQRGPLKKRQAGQELTREHVQFIRRGRRLLRAKMRVSGLKSRKDFELTASSMGLYFDKGKGMAPLLWLLHGRGLRLLLGALAALLIVLFLFSLVTQMRGHFTINLSSDLLRENFTLSETKDFQETTMHLFANPAIDVPCISISDLHEDVNDVDGQHNEAGYFAYTFYIRNEGEEAVDMEWDLSINSESMELGEAVWVMFFEDDKMRIFAKARDDGTEEAMPYYDDNRRGYLVRPLVDYAVYPDEIYQVVAETQTVTYYRVVPEKFEDDDRIISGIHMGVEPEEVHKYTVVMWLEGDDPDCTDALIGGHLGVDMTFRLASEEDKEESSTDRFIVKWADFWKDLAFWEN